MKAGRLDRRVTLQRPTFAKDAFNADVATWADLATVWAAKIEMTAREQMIAREKAAEITTQFQIRYSSTVADLNPKDRLTVGSATFDILGVQEMGRREGLMITAIARAD